MRVMTWKALSTSPKLQGFGVRKLEAFMASLVGVMSVCFVAEVGLLKGGDGAAVVEGIIVPIIPNTQALVIAISLLGAVVGTDG